MRSYVAVATPIGALVDKAPPSSRLYKAITAAGFLVLFLTFALMAPIGPAAFRALWSDPDMAPDAFASSINTLPFTAAGVALKGLGSALSNVAIYPDLVLDLPDDPVVQATITAWWNAAYAIGWAAGPLAGGGLFDVFTQNLLCVGAEALPPHCPAADHDALGFARSTPFPEAVPLHAPISDASRLPRLPNSSSSNSTCYCDWKPANGFDGFASSTALVSLAYALVLALVGCCNVRNHKPPAGLVRVASGDAMSVAPLNAAYQPTQ
jgi:hypothetical protein